MRNSYFQIIISHFSLNMKNLTFRIPVFIITIILQSFTFSSVAQLVIFDEEKEHLGSNINSPYPEVKPIITPDGKTLYFSRQNSPDNIKGKKDYQDIYYAHFSNNQWSMAKNIGAPLNDQYANGINSISSDGHTVLVFNGHTNSDDVPGAEISKRTRSGWSTPRRIKIGDFYNYSEFEDYQLTTDNKFLMMAIERDDSLGDQDLYVSFHKDDNSWTIPMNLGADINTEMAEFSPFLAADGKTLYFASEGHNGLGNSDIYYTKRLNDSWQVWSEPKNLGPSINTSELDAYFTIDAAGDHAYFISLEDGQRDIFRIKLHHDFKPDPVMMLYGFVYNAKTKKPIESRIVFDLLSTGNEEGIAHSNPISGKFNIILHSGKEYSYRAQAIGYMPIEESLDLGKIHKYAEVEQDLYLVPIEVGQIIKLTNVFFTRSKYKLLEESHHTLNRLVTLLDDNPNMTIELGGHTDNSGDSKLNLKLSLDRVESVKSYLTSKGVDNDRMTVKGYGGMKPILPNVNEVNREKNRRVEFKIISN
jgi:outer membrane protein OmpA-like peptidoglycan-associated protein